jgi:hypothetical protein
MTCRYCDAEIPRRLNKLARYCNSQCRNAWHYIGKHYQFKMRLTSSAGRPAATSGRCDRRVPSGMPRGERPCKYKERADQEQLAARLQQRGAA